MAEKYYSTIPGSTVALPSGRVLAFDYEGVIETDDEEAIATLDSIVRSTGAGVTKAKEAESPLVKATKEAGEMVVNAAAKVAASLSEKKA